MIFKEFGSARLLFRSAYMLPLAERMLFTMSMKFGIWYLAGSLSSIKSSTCACTCVVIDKSNAIADFSVEHLASAHCFVRLNEVNDVVRHLIVTYPRDVLHLVVDDDWCDVVLLLEDFRCLGGKGCGGMGTRDGMDGCKC